MAKALGAISLQRFLERIQCPRDGRTWSKEGDVLGRKSAFRANQRLSFCSQFKHDARMRRTGQCERLKPGFVGLVPEFVRDHVRIIEPLTTQTEQLIASHIAEQ